MAKENTSKYYLAINPTQNFTQYHPEFNPKWMAGLMEMRRDILLEQKVYENLLEFENEKMILQNPDNLEKKELHIYDDVVDEEIHSLELSNWLNLNKNY